MANTLAPARHTLRMELSHEEQRVIPRDGREMLMLERVWYFPTPIWVRGAMRSGEVPSVGTVSAFGAQRQHTTFPQALSPN
jgi:hypothetical protein